MLFPSRPQPIVVVSTLNQICANLALEQLLISQATRRKPLLFLWRNADCLILGRNQNLRSEVDLAAAESAQLDIARRFTGGGTVYQDLGNTVFTFIFPFSKIDRMFGNGVILDAVASHGVRGEASGRNDLLIGGRKFSGAAFQQTAKAFVHHGTIIRRTNVERMHRFLTPHSFKLEKHHNTPSVRSRITQLCDHVPKLEHEELVESIITSFKNKLQVESTERVHVDEYSPLLEEPEFLQAMGTLSSKEWVYGTSSTFTESVWFKNDHGIFELLLSLGKGKLIEDIKVCSDALDIDIPQRVEKVLRSLLRGKEFSVASVAQWVKDWDPLRSEVMLA